MKYLPPNVCDYKGSLMYLKKLKYPSNFNMALTKEIEKVRFIVIKMKKLNHLNVCTFVGACIHRDELVLLFTFEDRGSLEVYIYNLGCY